MVKIWLLQPHICVLGKQEEKRWEAMRTGKAKHSQSMLSYYRPKLALLYLVTFFAMKFSQGKNYVRLEVEKWRVEWKTNQEDVGETWDKSPSWGYYMERSWVNIIVPMSWASYNLCKNPHHFGGRALAGVAESFLLNLTKAFLRFKLSPLELAFSMVRNS